MGRLDRTTTRLVLLAAAVFVVLALASSSDVVRVWDAPGSTGRTERPIDRDPSRPRVTLPALEPERASERSDASWLAQAALVVLALVIAYIVYAIAVTWARRGRRGPRTPKVDVASADALPVVDAPIVVIDEEAQLAALREGAPRNAIVACWLRMEDDVAAAGIPHHPAETSTEYTSRVLAMTGLDARPIAELGSLYREARFSRHELQESHRDRAISAVQQIHRELAARAAEIEAARAAAAAFAQSGAGDTGR